MDEAALSEALAAKADRRAAAKLAKHVRPLKGVRGVPAGEIARLCAATWKSDKPHLDDDRAALDQLFITAWEDGLLAVGLVAAALPDDAEAAMEIGRDWLDRVDDPQTADALGWLVLGPAVLALGRDFHDLHRLCGGLPPAARRAVAAAALAALPIPLEGPAAAALRARQGERHIAFVAEPRTDVVEATLNTFLRDEDPGIRKICRRLLRVWTSVDPAAVAAWGEGVRGGLPKLLGDEVKRAQRLASA